MTTRHIQIQSERYCQACKFENLELRQSVLFGDGVKQVVDTTAVCVNADLCNELWNHLCDYYEEHADDEDDEDAIESDEWSFTEDAKYEDIHDL